MLGVKILYTGCEQTLTKTTQQKSANVFFVLNAGFN